MEIRSHGWVLQLHQVVLNHFQRGRPHLHSHQPDMRTPVVTQPGQNDLSLPPAVGEQDVKLDFTVVLLCISLLFIF